MTIEVVPASELSDELCVAWRRLQSSNRDLSNPFFSVDFTRAVATVRADARIAVIENNGTISALLPFQRAAKSVGIPIGGILSDYQGLICACDFHCDARELVKASGLVTWDFNHFLVAQTTFASFFRRQFASPIIDLSQGYRAYVEQRAASGSEQIKKCSNLARRIEREIGPLRFISHSTDPALLNKVLAWKSRQYLASQQDDLFQHDWPREIIRRIHQSQAADMAGALSLLYAGDSLIAGHFGMHSQTVWHYWFPAYDPQFAKYSPGVLLLLKMAEHAPTKGIRAIDLGLGMSLYKQRLSNGSVAVASGSIELPSFLSFRRRTRRKLRLAIAGTWLERPLRAISDFRKGSPS